METSRRNLLKKIGIGGAVGIASSKILANQLCGQIVTPAQPEGPFYPLQIPLDSDVDLTRVSGRLRRAKGEVIVVKGIITDQRCQPIKGAIVEIWQACHTGKYLHPSDTSNNELDPNFQYYGRMQTNAKGEYSFKTITPGQYDASTGWIRPPHIHYKVSLLGYEPLVTQLYFQGHELNRHDRILQSLGQEEQSKVVISFKQEREFKEGIFNITLKEL